MRAKLVTRIISLILTVSLILSNQCIINAELESDVETEVFVEQIADVENGTGVISQRLLDYMKNTA